MLFAVIYWSLVLVWILSGLALHFYVISQRAAFYVSQSLILALFAMLLWQSWKICCG